MARARLFQFFGFPLQPRNGFACVTVERFLTLHISRQLPDPRFQRFNRRNRALFLVFQCVALYREALKHSRSDGFFLAQSGQRIFALLAQLRRLPRGRFGLRGSYRALP